MERVNEETPKYLTTRTIQVMYMSNFNTIAIDTGTVNSVNSIPNVLKTN